MRITEVQAVLFESLDPADDAVPDGGLDVIVALDRHDIPWRVLPHRSAVRTVQWATRGAGAPVRRCLVVACTDEGARAAVQGGCDRGAGPARRRYRRFRRSGRDWFPLGSAVRGCGWQADPLVLREGASRHRIRRPPAGVLRGGAPALRLTRLTFSNEIDGATVDLV